MLKPGSIREKWAVLAAAALMSFSSLVAQGNGNRTEVQTQGDVRYLSGGIGVDQRQTITEIAAREKMNLKFVFAQRDGAFLSAVNVTITDASQAVRLQVRTDGPWLFVKLPAGDYSFRAEHSGTTRSGSVTVADTGRSETVVSFP